MSVIILEDTRMNNHMLSQSSQRDLFIDVVVEKFIFNNNRITLFPCFAYPN